MKRKGCSIIFLDDQNRILLLLRDDKPDIPYPNMWDVPGGHVDPGETPGDCIIREMKEEMELELTDFSLFTVMEFDDRIEYVFWKKENLVVSEIRLHEGQRIEWFTEGRVKKNRLAYGFNRIARDFYNWINRR